jgi:hypothetical protein
LVIPFLPVALLLAPFHQTPVTGTNPAPVSKSTDEESTSVVPVAEETLFIEAPSLIKNSVLLGRTQMQTKDYVDPGGSRRSAGFSNESSTDNAEQVSALRLYGFTLAPGEEITLKMKGESTTKLAMRLASPNVPDGMTPTIQKINRMPRPLRSSRITLKNILAEPFKMVLMVYGEAGYKYRIDIKRAK